MNKILTIEQKSLLKKLFAEGVRKYDQINTEDYDRLMSLGKSTREDTFYHINGYLQWLQEKAEDERAPRTLWRKVMYE